jgi:hypothetical protein
MRMKSSLVVALALFLICGGFVWPSSADGVTYIGISQSTTHYIRPTVGRIERAHGVPPLEVSPKGRSPSSSTDLRRESEAGPVWFQGNLSSRQYFSGGGGSCWAPGDCLAVGDQTVLFNNSIPSLGPPLPASFVFNSLPYALPALSCVSSTFCMLANTTNTSSPGFFLFTGSNWDTLSSPAVPSGTQIWSLSCASATFCLATGYHEVYPNITSYVWEYNGSTWSLADLPSPPAGATTPVGSTSVGCSGNFCLVGPLAQNASGAIWMATLSAGTWSYTEINTLSPTGPTTNGQAGAISCWTAGSCMVGVAKPATATPGFVTFAAGSWGPLVLPALSGAGYMPALACVSATDCVAGVSSANGGDLEQLNGASWSEIPGTTTPRASSTVWTVVSCPGPGSCFASNVGEFAIQHSPFPTSISISNYQLGAREMDLQATVDWPLVTPWDVPGPVTYEFDGDPIAGCVNLAISTSPGGAVAYPDCDIVFSGGADFSVSLSPDSYYMGSTSTSIPGTVAGGYWQFDADGSVYNFGAADWFGDASGLSLNAPIVGGAITPGDEGYWLLGSDGGVFSYGDAPFFGSTGSLRLNKPVVGMASTPDGGGYWFVASDGGIFSYGGAGFYGSTGALHLNAPIVGMAATPDGGGYWLVASDGGIFAFGDAPFYGSSGDLHLNKPIVGMAMTPDGGGYWLVASDGGIFPYGDAAYYGSTGGISLNKPIVGMAPTPDGQGYWLVAADGGVFSFGDARFFGSSGGATLSGPIVGISST